MNIGTLIRNRRISPSEAIADAFKTRVLADNGVFESRDDLISLIRMMRHKGLYDRASIILTPHGYKSGKLYTLKSANGDTDFTYTGGGGSRVDMSGNMVAVQAGTPKIDYSGGSPEILLERAATNILRNSETPVSQSITLNPVSYILSLYGTGSIAINESTPVSLTGNPDGSRKYIIFTSSGGARNITVTGNVKYAQLESMNNTTYYNFPTSWIPTGNSSGSRSAPILQNNQLGNIIDQNKGTLIFKLRRKGAGVLFRLDDGSNTNSLRFYDTYDSASRIQITYHKNNLGFQSTVLIPLPERLTIAISYFDNWCKVWINGSHFCSIENENVLTSSLVRLSLTNSITLTNRTSYMVYIPFDSSDTILKSYSANI
ncbi:MAG: hypothetical protein ACO1N9_05615 [Flavobacterium sp.]